MNKISNYTIKNGLIVAPMAGVTDAGFRSICWDCGCGLTVTEMISAQGLFHKSSKTSDYAQTTDSEQLKCAQIFGNDPSIMAQACQHPVLDKFHIIDINMGCPVHKVTSGGSGCALMKNIDNASRIVQECVSATSRPITVKFRLGLTDNTKNYLEFGKAMEQSGASAVTLHGRTREQKYSGHADWSAIAELRQALSIPVIANGDIVDKQSYDECRRITNCSMVAIGRGLQGNPWLLSELAGVPYTRNPKQAIIKHISILKQQYDDKWINTYMRHHCGWYVKGLHNASSIRQLVNTANSLDDLLNIVDMYL